MQVFTLQSLHVFTFDTTFTRQFSYIVQILWKSKCFSCTKLCIISLWQQYSTTDVPISITTLWARNTSTHIHIQCVNCFSSLLFHVFSFPSKLVLLLTLSHKVDETNYIYSDLLCIWETPECFWYTCGCGLSISEIDHVLRKFLPIYDPQPQH